VIMLGDVASDVTVTRSVNLYLNGYTITGKVTVDDANLTINNKLSASDGNPDSNVGTIQNTGLNDQYPVYHLGGNVNIGTGVGYSVLDIVRAYEDATGIKINYKFVDRRPGDIDECYANPEKAFKVLGWKAQFGIKDMCRDSFNWQQKNPNGYGEE